MGVEFIDGFLFGLTFEPKSIDACWQKLMSACFTTLEVDSINGNMVIDNRMSDNWYFPGDLTCTVWWKD